MKRNNRWVFVAILVATVLILGKPVSRTVQYAQSADGLLMLATYTDDDFSINPWSDSCFLVRQDTAVWLLSKFDWPYRNRKRILPGFEVMPLIHQAMGGRGQGLADSESWVPFSSKTDDRMFTLLKVFIFRGESIEEIWLDYTPVQGAILFGDVEVVELLVEHGADLTARIDRPDSKADEMNAFEFAEILLVGRFPEYHKETAEYLRTIKTNQ